MSNSTFSVKYCVLLPIVLIVTILLWALPVSAFGIAGLTVIQQRMIAIFVFAALMWMFEIIPNWTTSLVVIVVMLLTVSNKGLGFMCKPEFGTLVDYKSIMASFADPVVMLFLGGFVLAIIASKYGMDAAIAKVLLGLFGKKPKMVLLGFLIVIAIFSMFMSNTATAAMMLAFLAPVLKSLPENETGKVGLALAIPVSANLGGIGTPIGTPPNAIALGALENAGYQISFVTWMTRMVPFVIIMIAIAWFLLQFFFPFKSEKIELKIEVKERKKTWRDYVAWGTFFLTILLWVTESLTGINSNVVALIPLAVYTATGVFEKRDISEINWSVLWLVAGGFALGTGLNSTGCHADQCDPVQCDERGGRAGHRRPDLLPALQLHQQLRDGRPAGPDPRGRGHGDVRPGRGQQCAVRLARRDERDDPVHRRVRLHRDAAADLHAAERHRRLHGSRADQGHGQGRHHPRRAWLRARFLPADQAFPVPYRIT